MEERSLHIDVHREDGMFWSQVTEWPGCFATGVTLQELMEAIEDNVAVYITPDGQDLANIKLRIDGIDLRIGGEQPLTPAGGKASAERLRTPPRTHSPHSEWGFGRFERRGH